MTDSGIFETILSNCEMQCLITRKGGRHTTLTDNPLERNTDAAIDAIQKVSDLILNFFLGLDVDK